MFHALGHADTLAMLLDAGEPLDAVSEGKFGGWSLLHSAAAADAGASIDLEHDGTSRARGQKIACDLLALWGARGVIARLFDPMALWQAQCTGTVEGAALPAGHFIPEELPQATAQALHQFFSRRNPLQNS